MNTANLIKKSLKLAEVYLKEKGLEKVFQNKCIDGTDIMADALTGAVEVEQTYRKQLKIKKDVYIVSVEIAVTLTNIDGDTATGNGPEINYTGSAKLTKLDEYDMEVPVTHSFGHSLEEDNDFERVFQFINHLPKLKVKTLEEVKI